MIRESRLINARASTLTTDPTQYNARTAQANAAQQTLQYQAQLAANQAQTTGLNASGQGTLAAPVAKVATNTALVNAQNTYANQASGLQSQITQSVDPAGMVNQSGVMAAGNGELEQNAIDRMRASGMSDDQIRAKISDPAFLQSIQQSFEQVGMAAANPDSAFAGPSSTNALSRASGRAGLPDISTIKGYTKVTRTDPVTGQVSESYMIDENATKAAQQAEMQRRTQQQQNDIQANQKDAQGVSQRSASDAASSSSKDPGMDTAFAALIGGTQDPALQNLLTAAKAEADAIGMVPAGQEMSRDQFNAGADGQAIAKPYDAIDTILNKAGKKAEQFFDQSQSFLKEQQDRNDKLLAAQQANVQEQMAWQEQKLTRDLADANRKELDRMTVSYALRGGYGSDDANNQVSEARWKGEQAIADLQKEFGFKRTDVALQFTDLTQQAHDQYTVNWLNAQNNLEAKLSDLDIQGIANQQAKGNAIAGAYKGYMDEIKAGRKEYAGKVTDAAKFVYDATVKERETKAEEARWKYEQSWDEKKFGLTQSLEIQKFNQQQETNAINKAATGMQFSQGRYDKITNQINDNIKGDPVVKDYQDIVSKYAVLDSAYQAALKGGNRTGADQALIQMFNKLLDPSSVVRESEYDRTPENAPVLNRILGKWDQFKQGGVSFTDEDRKALFDMATDLKTKYQDRYNNIAQRYYLQMQAYNDTAPGEFQLTPDMFGLQDLSPTTTQLQGLDQLEQMRTLGPTSLDAPTPKVSGVSKNDLVAAKIGDREISVQPYLASALAAANEEFFKATGKNIQINEAYRDPARQADLYQKFITGQGGRASPPGKSFHEKGLAVDIANWEEAAPYLARYGLVNELADDRNHFSIGEFNPDYLALLTKPAA